MARVESCVSNAIAANGLSPRDYFVMAIAIASAEQTKPSAVPPTPVARANAAFLRSRTVAFAVALAHPSRDDKKTVLPRNDNRSRGNRMGHHGIARPAARRAPRRQTLLRSRPRRVLRSACVRSGGVHGSVFPLAWQRGLQRQHPSS